MKWKNKGHQFDDIVLYYCNKFKSKFFWVFGTGIVATEYKSFFRCCERLKGFVDNNIDKDGTFFLGKTIISFTEWMQKYKNDNFLLICVGEKTMEK